MSGASANITIKDLSGNGTVELGAKSLTLSAAKSTFSGGILGTGRMTVSGAGTETLSGTNTYTGDTTIGGNSKLSITGAGSIASSSKVAAAGVFDIASASGNVTISTLSGTGTVNLGGNSVILSNASTTFTGGINGTGGVTVGGGSATFSSTPKTYGGTTTISKGATFLLSGAGAISNSSVADDGTFSISTTTSGTSITSLSGSGSVSLGAHVLTLSNASGIFTGGITSGNNTTNGLAIAGGTQALMGVNTFKGATTVSPLATLTGTGSIAGNLVNEGKVRPFDPTTPPGTPGSLKVGGNYSQTGTGSLQIAIGGTAPGTYGRLTVSGTVALAGGLDVDLVNGFLFPQGTSTYDILDYKLGSRNNLIGDFSTVSFNGKACTGGGSDAWLCGFGLSFTESFTNIGHLQLVVSETPEPGTLAILATGLLSLLGLRRRRKA